MKCRKCQITKKTSEFHHRKNDNKSRLCHDCIECMQNPNYRNRKSENGGKITYYKNYKNNCSCQNCGYHLHPSAIIFHHKDPKNKIAVVSDMRRSKYSLEDLQNEIKKCMVLCANCHHYLHSAGKLPPTHNKYIKRGISLHGKN